MASFNAQAKHRFAWLANFLVPLSGAGVDVYTPSLPHMVAYFHSSASLVQLTMTAYVLGFGLSQLVFGPVTDSLGRKTVILVNLFAFMLCTGLILINHDIRLMLLLRLMQGLCVGGISVPARAILVDCFTGIEFKKRVNTMTLCWAMGTIVSPFIGGILQRLFDWHANFVFLLAYAAIAFVVSLLILAETHTKRERFHPSQLLTRYIPMFRHLRFLAATSFIGFLYAPLIAYNLKGPFLLHHKLHLSAFAFGNTAMGMGLAWLLGNLLSKSLIHYSVPKKSLAALCVMIIAVSLLYMLNAQQQLSLWRFILPIMLIVFCASSMFPSYVILCMSLFPDRAGSANALLFSGLWIWTSIITFVLAHVDMMVVGNFVMGYMVIIVVTLLIFLTLLRRWDHQPIMN